MESAARVTRKAARGAGSSGVIGSPSAQSAPRGESERLTSPSPSPGSFLKPSRPFPAAGADWPEGAEWAGRVGGRGLRGRKQGGSARAAVGARGSRWPFAHGPAPLRRSAGPGTTPPQQPPPGPGVLRAEGRCVRSKTLSFCGHTANGRSRAVVSQMRCLLPPGGAPCPPPPPLRCPREPGAAPTLPQLLPRALRQAGGCPALQPPGLRLNKSPRSKAGFNWSQGAACVSKGSVQMLFVSAVRLQRSFP